MPRLNWLFEPANRTGTKGNMSGREARFFEAEDQIKKYLVLRTKSKNCRYTPLAVSPSYQEYDLA